MYILYTHYKSLRLASAHPTGVWRQLLFIVDILSRRFSIMLLLLLLYYNKMSTLLKYNYVRINPPTDWLARNHEGRVFGRLKFQIENFTK